jgi:hypothetical protein
MQQVGVVNPKTNERIQRHLGALLPIAQRCRENAIKGCIGDEAMIIRATEKSVRAKLPSEVPSDEIGVEFDEDKIDRIVSDVRDEAHLNPRRATRGKYKQDAG